MAKMLKFWFRQASRSLKRSINDLYSWKTHRDRTLENKVQEKNFRKWQEYYDISYKNDLGK